MPDDTPTPGDPATFGRPGGARNPGAGKSAGTGPTWRTINGHHVKFDGAGKVVAGRIPGVTHDAAGKPIGAVSASRARQHGHSLEGGRSIADLPPRSKRDAARDAFSRAKLEHGAARAAHKANPTAGTAGHLAAARKALGERRAAYRAASGGRIEARPLDSLDPRVRAARSARPLAAFGREARPDIPARERRENRVLMAAGPPVAVAAHHHGEPAPKFQRDDVPAIKRAAKLHERGRQVDPADLAHEARYADRKASESGRENDRAYLVYDRLTGGHAVEQDSNFKYNRTRHESYRSGRFDVLKAYGAGGREVPVDAAVMAHLKGGHAMFKGGGGGKSGKGGTGGAGKLSGGHWATIGHHHIYVVGGKVVAGGIPGRTHGRSGTPRGHVTSARDEHHTPATYAKKHGIGEANAFAHLDGLHAKGKVAHDKGAGGYHVPKGTAVPRAGGKGKPEGLADRIARKSAQAKANQAADRAAHPVTKHTPGKAGMVGKPNAENQARAEAASKPAGKASPAPSAVAHRTVKSSAPRTARETAVHDAAKASGKSAMVVTSRPQYAAHGTAGAPTEHHVGGRKVATHRVDAAGKHVVTTHHRDGTTTTIRHNTKESAKRHLEAYVKHRIDRGTTTHAVVGKHGTLSSFDHRKHGIGGKHHKVTARVLGDGGHVKFAEPGEALLAMFKGGGSAKAGGPPKAGATAAGHAGTGKGSGGCGTGAGGFKAGNTCGHRGNRNATVETARAAHAAARREVVGHVKAHRKAAKAAAKAGTAAPHPKELHAAIKKAAAAHGALKAAQDTHRAEQRARKNAAGKAARAVKAGKAQPITAKPAPPARVGQAKAAPTDKGTAADRLGVAAARHRRVAQGLIKRADATRRQADKEGPRAAGHVKVNTGGRGLPGVGAVGHVAPRSARQGDLDAVAGRLEHRARKHGQRALGLEQAAARAGKAPAPPNLREQADAHRVAKGSVEDRRNRLAPKLEARQSRSSPKAPASTEPVRITGDTFPVKEQLKALGGRYGGGAWHVPANKADAAWKLVGGKPESVTRYDKAVAEAHAVYRRVDPHTGLSHVLARVHPGEDGHGHDLIFTTFSPDRKGNPQVTYTRDAGNYRTREAALAAIDRHAGDPKHLRRIK